MAGSLNLTNLGAAGLSAATERFTASARRTVGGQGDLAAEVVEQVSDKTALDASLAVVKTGDEMLKRLLDVLA